LVGGTDLSVIICDRDRCVSAANISKRETLEKPITPELENLIEKRQSYVYNGKNEVGALEGLDNKVRAMVPIISSGDISGAVVLVENPKCFKASDTDLSLLNVAAKFLANQMQ